MVGRPGKTKPLLGVTVNHAAPWAAAVKEIGPPVVTKVRVWAAGGFGGVTKSKLVALMLSVGKGAVTVRLMGTRMVAKVFAATWRFAVYVPTGSPLGFTRTVRAAGRLPASGVAESHRALLGLTVTVKAAVLVPPLIASVLLEGMEVPLCQVNASETGTGASTVWASPAGANNVAAQTNTNSSNLHVPPYRTRLGHCYGTCRIGGMGIVPRGRSKRRLELWIVLFYMAITTAVERSKGKGRGPAQILLIEDSPSDAMLFGEALKEALPEANLHWVTAAEDGLRRLRPEGTRGLPDLIVCDLNLQGSTALDSWRRSNRIRPRPAFRWWSTAGPPIRKTRRVVTRRGQTFI